MKKFIIASIILIASFIVFKNWEQSCHEKYENPFPYDLHYRYISGESPRIIICMHGLCGNYKIAKHLKSQGDIKESLVSFNFPDHSIQLGHFDPAKTTFGSIDELLPALFVFKKVIIDCKTKNVDFYGFSAGSGALINTIKVLSSSEYDHDLRKIGINQTEKDLILQAIQNGFVILDCPLRSIEEIIAFRGSSPELEAIGERYRKNNLRPIDSIQSFENLSLRIILGFCSNDDIISNRDDKLFTNLIKKYNSKGTTFVVQDKKGRHSSYHKGLWDLYINEVKTNPEPNTSL